MEFQSAQSSERGSERSYSVSSERDHSLKGTPSRGPRNGYQRRPLNRPRVVEVCIVSPCTPTLYSEL